MKSVRQFPGFHLRLDRAFHALPMVVVFGLTFQACAAETKSGADPAAASKALEKSTPTGAKSREAGGGEDLVLFDGKSLKGWVVSDFAGKGQVKVEEGKIVIGMGYMTGITYTNTNTLPRMSYEVSLEAMRVEGSDFFCGLTFPVGKDPCSLIVGGWGAGVVGLSSLDGEDAANNETTKYLSFQNGRWYKIRLRVVPEKIQAWLDDEQIVDVSTKDRRISIRIEVEPSVPFGIATYSTTGAVRNLKIKRL
jgi:hypothetical protein